MRYIKTVNYDPGKYPKGYFMLMGKSRSGHHFIKNNIVSWLNGGADLRHYLNLENHNIKDHKFFINKLNIIDIPDTINVMVVRDLLNWFTSFVYFTLRDRNPKGRQPKKHNINNIKHVSEWTAELDKDPDLIFIPNSTPKDFFMKNSIVIDENFSDKFCYKLGHSLDNWLEHEKEFNSDTNYLNDTFIKLSYDSFVEDKDYRINICEQIGGVYNEDMIDVVPKAGKGSSFDYTNYDGNGSNMNVLERYKQWKPEHLKYLDVLKNHEALQYYTNTTELSDDKKLFIDSL